jgi:hypothetical protein
MRTALLIPADRSKRFETIQIDDKTELSTLQKAVGGMIEMYPIPIPDLTVWINGDPYGPPLPNNHRANVLTSQLIGSPMRQLIPIGGNVVVMGGIDHEGNTLSISSEVIASVKAVTA